jgi:hypothetical protein
MVGPTGFPRELQGKSVLHSQPLSDVDFTMLSIPLDAADGMLQSFARRVGGQLVRNFHNYPNRKIYVHLPQSPSRVLSVSPVHPGYDAIGRPRAEKYVIGIAAYHDTGQHRTFWAQDTAEVPPEQIDPATLVTLLDQAWNRLQQVDMNYLERHGQAYLLAPCA